MRFMGGNAEMLNAPVDCDGGLKGTTSLPACGLCRRYVSARRFRRSFRIVVKQKVFLRH